MINRSQLKFHETFQPESTYITKIVELANDCFSGDKYRISEETGIPTGKQKGKVEPHIKYSKFMGLIDYSLENGIYSLSITDFGRIILREDKYFHEILSKWLCHYKISSIQGAPQWNYIVHQINHNYLSSYSANFVIERASEYYSTKISFEELFGVVKRSYTDGFFCDLNYLKWDEGLEYVEHFSHQELTYVYAYALMDSWEQIFNDKQEITINDIDTVIGFSKVFNFSSETTDEVLDLLSREGFISINRQLSPITTIKLTSSDEVIEKAYSCLL